MNRWKRWIRKVMTALILTGTPGVAMAQETLRPLDYLRPALALDKFSLKLMRFTCNRELQTPDIECADYYGRVATEFDLTILKYGFWRNEVHGEGTQAKFMTIGWHWEMGIRLTDQIEIYHDHHSRHVLDREQRYEWREASHTWAPIKYPVEDSYGIRIIFYERKK